MTDLTDEYDSPWKDILEAYFQDFMLFFFPAIHDDINWQRSYDFLDQELQQVVRDAELGNRFADKLVKVWKQSGEETWVLIHIEIQSQEESRLAAGCSFTTTGCATATTAKSPASPFWETNEKTGECNPSKKNCGTARCDSNFR